MAEGQENNLEIGEGERVGDYLHRIRKIRGLDLDHLAKSIRLGKNILEAIEANNWSYFPTEAYLRSYIVSLCDKLSLDKTVVLKKFSAEINSQFWITQTNLMSSDTEQEKESPDSAASSVPKAAIIIVLIIIAVLFFASKILNNYSKEEDDDFDTEGFPKIEEEAVEENATDSLSVTSVVDTVPIAKVAEVQIPAVIPGSDTLRLECTPSATDSTCGVTVKGVDTKMGYFKRMTTKYINREDTMQVTITVPLRTKLFVNNTKLDYGNFNTLLFYNGKVVNKINRELR